MFKKLKQELLVMFVSGSTRILLGVLEVKIPGYEKLWIVLEFITVIIFGSATICLILNSSKKWE